MGSKTFGTTYYISFFDKLQYFSLYYSVLKAFTGSRLLAILAGIKPAIIVKNILINTSIIPACHGKNASTFTPVIDSITAFIGQVLYLDCLLKL